VGPEPERPDELIEAVVARLRHLPTSEPRARAAILARVRGRRPSPWRAALTWFWQPSVPAVALIGTAVIAVAVGYSARAVVGPTSTVLTIATESTPELTPVGYDASAPRLVATQFILDAPEASRVNLVGAFNDWDAEASPLVATGTPGVWSVSVLLPPGRHEYAFVVDGVRWTPDPRAPQVADPDFGRANSVAMVAEQ
jgi:hypothetical protein